ncbi:hypothetical protein [Jannaschia sp. W003]|uniref:hypothetical protein n=1 Tax=Jannaschia sp. W003 TaxID=2867012 RepID=UPI0021A96D86|nr:hypothetical protein [Jannaschia sp. W003]UWQ23111.1 hypothetical protein K3554_16240 [Jannaschia sp. W003]
MILYVRLSDLHDGAPAGPFRRRAGLPDIAAALGRALGAPLGDAPPPMPIPFGDSMDLRFPPGSDAHLTEAGRRRLADVPVLFLAGARNRQMSSEAMPRTAGWLRDAFAASSRLLG